MKFKWLTGDKDYLDFGGKWISKEIDTGLDGVGRFGIELINYLEATGEKLEGNKIYAVQLSWIPCPYLFDKTNLPNSLLEDYDKNWLNTLNDKQKYLLLYAAIWEYGKVIPIDCVHTNNFRKVKKELKELAELIHFSNAYKKDIFDKVVNLIGQTGREFIFDNLSSALDRGLKNKDVNAYLIARIYGIPAKNLEKAYGITLEECKKEAKNETTDRSRNKR